MQRMIFSPTFLEVFYAMSQTKKIKFLSRKIGKTLSDQGLNIPEVDALLLKNKNDKALIKRCEHRK
jgi:hypothetical protein